MENYGIIDKKFISSHYNKFINKKYIFRKLSYTSGTTGSPQRYLRDVRCIAAEKYFQDKYFNWARKYIIEIRSSKLFSPEYQGRKIFKTLPFCRYMFVSAFHMQDKTLVNLVSRLKTIKNKCLWAFPSSAYMLAEYCVRNKIKLDFDVVITSSEVLHNYQSEIIMRA
ncbi:MAG: hypothetical protein Q7S39_03205, partial [Ignavibacteria bacterium]|nr:hypothetical protein [Ignavibacteria bacterium]